MTTSLFSRPWITGSLLGALSVLAPTAGTFAQEYKIKIHRTEKVGGTFALSAKGSSNARTSVTLPGAPPKTQEQMTEIEFEGTFKVLEANNQGRATKLSCTVNKCLLNDKPLCDKGDAMTVEANGTKSDFTIKGEKVDEATAKALSMAIDLSDAEQKGDDDTCFGTDQPQKVGGTWPVSGEVLAQELTRRGLAVKGEDVKGTGKLVEVKQVDAKDVLTVAADVTIDGVKPPMPPNLNVESSSLTLHISGQLPADENARPSSQTSSMEMKVRATAAAPDGQNVTVNVIYSQNTEKTFSDAKK